jgi:hypothetical protein
MGDQAKELKRGEKVVKGPKIYFWVISILAGLGTFGTVNFGGWLIRNIGLGPRLTACPIIRFPFSGTSFPWLFLALYVVALVGLYMRKGWAVPIGRAALIVSMIILFPIGTVFGAVLWKRFNDPVAKKFLNYGFDKKEDDGPDT